MQIQLTFLRSKIARRIFGLFIISTLVPVIFLAFFSYRQINTLTHESVQNHLRQEAKSYGNTLYYRLNLLEESLIQLASRLSQKRVKTENFQEQFSSYFSSVGIVDNTLAINMLWGNKFPSPSLTDQQKKHLENKSLILTRQNTNKLILVYRPPAIKASTLIAQINPGFLWGERGSFDLRLSFCVLNENAFYLFCSDPSIEKTKDQLFKNSWNLYLKPRYFIEKFSIVFSQPKNEALAPLNIFKTIFSGVILFSLLVVAYISIYLIRKNTLPLESLMDGINRISNDDFKHPVPVTSHDEFGLLATSFNSMSSRISKQLDVLNALAEIDQLILTRLKTEDILSIIMTRTGQVIYSDLISVALVNKDNQYHLETYTSGSKHHNGIEQRQYQINQTEVNELTTPWLFQTIKDNKPLSNYLEPLANRQVNCFLILPLVISNKLTAIISLGFFKDPALSISDKSWAREYANRIAVALSNASWEQTLYHQAHYDVLTGLPNRQLLNDRLQQALFQAKKEQSLVAIFFIDLDRFKSINDSLGHAMGDNLLQVIAQRIERNIYKGNSVARMGGDEFIVLLPSINQDSSAITQVAVIAETLLNRIAEPVQLDGHDIRISASIGIGISPDDGIDADTLIKNADIAMYHAKDKGKGNFQFYSEKLNKSTLKRLLLESDLIGAIERNEFELYYQSKVIASTGKIVGAEALIRWNHPTKGLVPPFEFIPIIETTSMIISLGDWVIRTACFQNKKWQQQGVPAILVAVNVAVKQLLHPGFVESVEKALQDSGLDPCWLELEITESAAMDDMKGTIAVLHQLKALGISLSIDDYGTGYSSLQYMKDFPIDVLKIDQSFIFKVLENHQDAAIVQSTITLAHNFGLKVIAEGVETQAHQEYLAEQGCDELQGYFFSRPVPVKDFIKLLKSPNESISITIGNKE